MSYLCFGEDEGLQTTVKVSDGELYSLAPRVESDHELWFVLEVEHPDDLPRSFGQLAAPERADEGKLRWKSKRKYLPVKQKA